MNYLDRIENESPLDYLFLCAAAHDYQENGNGEALVEVKRLLDKHGVKYIDDVTGGVSK